MLESLNGERVMRKHINLLILMLGMVATGLNGADEGAPAKSVNSDEIINILVEDNAGNQETVQAPLWVAKGLRHFYAQLEPAVPSEENVYVYGVQSDVLINLIDLLKSDLSVQDYFSNKHQSFKDMGLDLEHFETFWSLELLNLLNYLNIPSDDLVEDESKRVVDNSSGAAGAPINNKKIKWKSDGSNRGAKRARKIKNELEQFAKNKVDQMTPAKRLELLRSRPDLADLHLQLGLVFGPELYNLAAVDINNIVFNRLDDSYFVIYKDETAQKYDISGNPVGANLNDVSEIVVSPRDGSYFVIHSNLKAQRYDISGGPVGGLLRGVLNIFFNPLDDRYFVVYSDRTVQRYDGPVGVHLNDVSEIVVSPRDGSYFVIHSNLKAQRYDISGNPVGGLLGRVLAIVFNPGDGSYFVIYSDLKAQRYDISGGPVGEHLNDVRGIVVSPWDGSYFVIYSDLKAQRYDISGGPVGAHLNNVRAIVFKPRDGSYFVIYSDLKAQRYDISGRPVGECLNDVLKIVVSPNGKRYAIIYLDKIIFYRSNFMLNPEQELKLKQLVAGLYLGGQIVLKNMLESFKQNWYRPVGLSAEELRYLPVELAELLQEAGYLKSIVMDGLRIATDGQAPASAAGAAAGTV
jgi:hypothetical protein